ncbi:angiopoietin-related protein 7-like [Aplysia californica]|uniref:Angiopoietin-related protein 7-like n=1 Tax=Aplysia californica TaxID=6500 RepID=A0ABM1A0Z4_APLCA|nr:angiopoietin-related protein 7-like [Aplysia californica]
MDATWTFIPKLILAAALVMSSRAWHLNVTSSEIDVGRTAQVSLNCFNPYQQQDITDLLMMRIEKKQLTGWSSVAELRHGDVDVRLTANDVTATGNIVSGANSFMRLTWPLATNDTIGLYRCDVTFLNSHGSVGWQKGLPTSISRKSDVTFQILSEMVEETKRQCTQQKQDIQTYVAAAVEENKRHCLKEKQDVLQNMTAMLKALEILETVTAALERNQREVLLHSQRLLANTSASLEQRLSDVEDKLWIRQTLYLAISHSRSSNSSLWVSLQPQSCASVKGFGPRPVVLLSSGQRVVCDTVTDQGGWIVIQRRVSADVDFFRGWEDYKNGFGDLHGNFWLGLEKIHQLTSQASCLRFKIYCSGLHMNLQLVLIFYGLFSLSLRFHHQVRHELRFDLRFQGKNYYASYDKFSLSGETDNYRIQISGFSGNVDDNMVGHNGQPFSTNDRDNDSWEKNCASVYHGAWWYNNCHSVNLNGLWGSTGGAKGLRWKSVTTGSVSFSEMKIRPFAK